MLLWTNHVTEQHYGIIDSLKQTGYDGIELFLGEGNEQHYSRLGKHFSDIAIGVTCVASLAPEENIASPDQSHLWPIPFKLCLLYTSASQGRRKAMEY